MRWMRAHLTYANVVTSLVLLVALGGGTYAVAGQLAAEKQIKACVTKSGPAKGAVRIAKTCKSNERSVVWNQTGVAGPQGAAGPAGTQGASGPAGSPDTPAQVLSKLATVDGAGSGLDADTLDGVGTDIWHEVGAGGEPTFLNSWVNANLGADPTGAAYTKDATGVVHVRGQVKNGTVDPIIGVGTVFQLPVGYRPSGSVYVSALTTDGNNVITPGWVGVSPNGYVGVGVGNNAFVSLTVSFRP